MSDKAYTILLTSNSSTKVRTVTISKSWVNAFLVSLGIILLILGCLFYDYIKVLSSHNQTNALLSENLILKQKFQLVENKLLDVEKKINRVGHISQKIDQLNLSFTRARSTSSDSENGLNLSSLVDEVTDVKVPSSIGPLQATMSPLESFFNKLKFFKKAPLEEIANGNKTIDKVESVEGRLIKALQVSGEQELIALKSWEGVSQKKNIYDSTPNIRPVRNGWYTSKFGYRRDPFTGSRTMHSGLDIAAAPGTSIFSPASGVVSYVGFESGYGNLITIDHGYGVKTRYAHNSEVFVKYGQKVKRGQKIAAVGNTGRSSGYHLHYEVRVNGVAVDPKKYIIE